VGKRANGALRTRSTSRVSFSFLTFYVAQVDLQGLRIDYQLTNYRAGDDLSPMSILVKAEPVDALSMTRTTATSDERASSDGRKLKDLIRRTVPDPVRRDWRPRSSP